MFFDSTEKVIMGRVLLRRAMADFLYRKSRERYKEGWWTRGFYAPLARESKFSLDKIGISIDDQLGISINDQFQTLDLQALLTILKSNADNLFEYGKIKDARGYADELKNIRNNTAHDRFFTWKDAFQALGKMATFAEWISAPEAKDLRKLAEECQRQSQRLNEDLIGQRLRGLKDKHITTIKKSASSKHEIVEFHVYEVNDAQIKYDPIKTNSPGWYWSFLVTFTLLIEKIERGELVLRSSGDVQKMYDESDIGIYEGLTAEFVFGILCWLQDFHPDGAGRVLECRNRNCHGWGHVTERRNQDSNYM